ncbi:putative oxidoreductase [Sinobacterium norvegicum]|uniref:Oxidoreductase n=1 Tax=Sinobacterium norvegicum TaxID=1641715 RepID=A0ABN8EHX3_9GAMM|nr:SDR family NAD(P)-dependent oxidoreductase [Sinobacterium norvegicum]CAH0991970.1 putative oxidoreductase [Sinobacterium norvegicum]
MLKNKRVIITGAGRGIGYTIAQHFIELGAKVAIIDVDETLLAESKSALKCAGYVADVADEEQISLAIEQAAADLGGLDCLINNAGTGALAPLDQYSGEQFDHIIRVNLHGTFFATKAAIKLLQSSATETLCSSIINITSQAGERPTFGEAPYCAAKAGVTALTKSTALEYGPAIRCNAISPGFINSPMTEGIVNSDLIKPLLQSAPSARVGTMIELAQAAAFLASEQSSYMTGQTLAIDGGTTLPQAGVNDITKGLTIMLAGGG